MLNRLVNPEAANCISKIRFISSTATWLHCSSNSAHKFHFIETETYRPTQQTITMKLSSAAAAAALVLVNSSTAVSAADNIRHRDLVNPNVSIENPVHIS